jgi:hypothetical protein
VGGAITSSALFVYIAVKENMLVYSNIGREGGIDAGGDI